ncbi:MAG: TonB family protein [Deltaproteobacteria bacterium]|nr:TonB family protein [Deltaproteobacteria bacterium]
MTRLETTNIENDVDFDLADGLETERLLLPSTLVIDQAETERILKYCIIVAFLLHFLLFFVVTRIVGLQPQNSLLKPGEKITQVRLVEPQEPWKTSEPPPKEAAAISDRDHTALKERLPKMPLPPKPPIGSMQEPPRRMASLAPPVAPEDLIKKKTESPEDDPKKANNQDRAQNKSRTLEKEVSSSNSKPRDNRKNIDLRPTRSEIARGLSSSVGGPNDFFPDGDIEEAVVDINTREDKFFSYMLHLKRKIQGVWVYPTAAAQSGLGGSLAVEFSISKEGELLYVNLLDSSGHSILDESAMKAIKSAAPYYPFPPRLHAKRLRIRANFIYVTSNFLRNIM